MKLEEIATVQSDGKVTVFLHEPEHVAALITQLLATRKTGIKLLEENKSLRVLLQSMIPDTARLNFVLKHVAEDQITRKEIDEEMGKEN